MSVALLVPSTSRKRSWSAISDSTFAKVFCPTLNTTTWSYSRGQRKIFLGVDSDDPLLATEAAKQEMSETVKRMVPGCSFEFVLFDKDKLKPGHLTAMWNLLFKVAYEQGFDYFYQCGDDIEFMQHGWMEKCVDVLERDAKGQIGCVGPVDHPAGFGFLTQSFVSRRHMEIFGWYFPEEIYNWHCDYWMTAIYRKFDKLWMLADYSIKNHEGCRYDVVDGIHLYGAFVDKYSPELERALRELSDRPHNL